MQECIRVIQTDGATDGWLRDISSLDIQRIIARYKEHVRYWNISMEAIQAELQAFTLALDLGHNYFEIATIFDASPDKRLQPER